MFGRLESAECEHFSRILSGSVDRKQGAQRKSANLPQNLSIDGQLLSSIPTNYDNHRPLVIRNFVRRLGDSRWLIFSVRGGDESRC